MTTSKSVQPVPAAFFHGHSAKQIEAVFNDVMLRAWALKEFVAEVRERHPSSELTADLMMVHSQALLIGAMADEVTGAGYIGSVTSWATGVQS